MDTKSRHISTRGTESPVKASEHSSEASHEVSSSNFTVEADDKQHVFLPKLPATKANNSGASSVNSKEMRREPYNIRLRKSSRNPSPYSKSERSLPTQPANMDLDDNQVDDLLKRVNMNNSFLDLANTDQELITLMKNTIEFQRGVMKKRETMVKINR